MKIDKPSKPLPTSSAGEVATHAPAKGKSSPPPSAQPTSSTSVSLGSTATQLNSMESSMVNTPVVDASKVAEIKQAISEGRFKVNSGVVADRLIETVRDLIGGGA
jgi:negative regulator of flagellin synthesis FlgM